MNGATLERQPERRGFLVAAMCGFAGMIAGALGIPALRYLFYSPNARRGTSWLDAGDISGLESGEPQEIAFRSVRVDGWRVAAERTSAWVIKAPSGSITAFVPACTHLGCAYHWDSGQRQFLCPCHGSRFAMDGKVLAGPAPRPLDRYEVRVVGSRLWLGESGGSGGVRS